MSMDTSGLALREPDKVDWDHLHTGSQYQAPPAVTGPDGKPITYSGKVMNVIPGVTKEGYREYLVDPIVLPDGYVIKFTRINVKKFISRKTGEPLEASSVINFLKAAGIQAKPQTNADYDAAVKAVVGRPVNFTIDLFASNKDTGEKIRGFKAFPIDPATGQRQVILRQGNTYNVLDDKGEPTGQTAVVKADVLFANAQVKFFQSKK